MKAWSREDPTYRRGEVPGREHAFTVWQKPVKLEVTPCIWRLEKMTRGTGGITAVSDLSMYKIFAFGPLLRRDVLVGVVAVAGGYLGSLLHQTMNSNSAIIRAERFEVVERSGRLSELLGARPG